MHVFIYTSKKMPHYLKHHNWDLYGIKVLTKLSSACLLRSRLWLGRRETSDVNIQLQKDSYNFNISSDVSRLTI
jgi:hypothetical protein